MFESLEIVLFSFIAAVTGVAMFYRELTIEHPIVDLRAFRDLNFVIGCLLFSFILRVAAIDRMKPTNFDGSQRPKIVLRGYHADKCRSKFF
jgi:hypothetical protein